MPSTIRPIIRRRAFALLYSVIMLSVLMGITSFAIDYGRTQLVKSQLRHAVDAAARHAIRGLKQDATAASNYAIDAADDNLADGMPVVLNENEDIEFGAWDSEEGTFTVLTGSARSSANAVRVTARRSSARGNAVPLVFARLLGKSSCDVTATAIALRATGADPYPIVGLQFVESESDAISRIDSYNSNSGPYASGSGRNQADVASNGDIKLRNGASVYGDCHPGVGKTFKYNPTVTGSKAKLTKPLNYPKASSGDVPTNNNNNAVPSAYLDSSKNFLLDGNKTYTLPAGTYYFKKFQLLNTATLTMAGPVKIYCTDRVDIDSTVKTYQDIPGNFRLVSLSTVSDPTQCEIEVEGKGNVYMDIYAPQCEVDIEDNANFHGYVVGGSLEISENAFVHYDEASGGPSSGTNNTTVLVR